MSDKYIHAPPVAFRTASYGLTVSRRNHGERAAGGILCSGEFAANVVRDTGDVLHDTVGAREYARPCPQSRI